MTTDAKQTAMAIIDKYMVELDLFSIDAIKAAIIHVNGIIDAEPTKPTERDSYRLWVERRDDSIKYWESVKTEINKL